MIPVGSVPSQKWLGALCEQESEERLVEKVQKQRKEVI